MHQTYQIKSYLKLKREIKVEQEQMFSNLDIDRNGALSQDGNLNAKIFTEQKWHHYT